MDLCFSSLNRYTNRSHWPHARVPQVGSLEEEEEEEEFYQPLMGSSHRPIE